MLKLNDQRGYRKFVNGRDEALETLLRNSRLRSSELTSEAFTKILEIIHVRYDHIMKAGDRRQLESLEQMISMVFENLAFSLWLEMVDLRKKAYMLAYAGEAQAIGQITAKTPKVSLSNNRLTDLMHKNLSKGIQPLKSFQLKFNQLRRQIISSLEYSFAFGDTVDKAMGRVYLKLPKRTGLPKKKVLKTVKVTEAQKPSFSQFSKGETDSVELGLGKSPFSGFEWDQETWDRMIKDLASDHVFTDRSPEKFLDITNPFSDLPVRDQIPEEDKIYHWEIEQDSVQDFVEQVRSGQIDAAKKNGIDDFVWIAILDDRTDDCCEWRSGLLTSEIEARLKTDKSDDDCQAIVPPAHFNCRCTLAPASQDLEAVDNTDTEREFDEWLNQK